MTASTLPPQPSTPATSRLDPAHATAAPQAAQAVVREANRLRALLVRIADAIDIALDADWRVAIDILLDLSDEIHAELVP